MGKLDDKALEAAMDAYADCDGMKLKHGIAAAITAYLAALDPREQTLQRLAKTAGVKLVKREDAALPILEGEVGEVVTRLRSLMHTSHDAGTIVDMALSAADLIIRQQQDLNACEMHRSALTAAINDCTRRIERQQQEIERLKHGQA